MRSLLWKEWHEQRWKLAFGSLILAAFALVGLRARVIADETLLYGVCVLAVLLLPVLSSTGLVPAERNDRTLETLFALPVPPWRIFIVKTIMGIALCAGPIFLTAIVSVLIAGGRELSAGAILLFFARTLAASLVLFFWMFCLTVRLPSETRAGLIALAVLVIWLVATLGLVMWGMPDQRLYLRSQAAPASQWWLVSPFVFLFGPQVNLVSRPAAAAIQFVLAIVLWIIASTQFARPEEG